MEAVSSLPLWIAQSRNRQVDAGLRYLVGPEWYKHASAVLRVALTPGRRYPQVAVQLNACKKQIEQIRQQGFGAIEIFAPSHGGKSFNGLDTKDYFHIDPAIGTMQDFEALVRTAHENRLAVIIFTNLGYSSVDAPFFLKACDDARLGRDTPEIRWFMWSNSPDAPAPGRNDTFFMVRPTRLPGYDPRKGEVWVWSERAARYYWSKWSGFDDGGRPVRLPQYNWGAPEWQREAKRIVEFWMKTGLDGMIIDAVNWYVNITWHLVRGCMTDVIHSYGNAYAQPEGGGGFREDPVAWITEGGWNSLADYGLGIWWEKTNVIRAAVESGDPRPIETALREYHDPVVAAGGVLYFSAPKFEDPQLARLSLALVALLSDLVLFEDASSLNLDETSRKLLRLKQAHPAVHQIASRRKLPTFADDKHYAVLKTAPDDSERVLLVFNTQPTTQQVSIDLSGVMGGPLRSLKSGKTMQRRNPLTVDLPPWESECLSVDRQ